MIVQARVEMSPHSASWSHWRGTAVEALRDDINIITLSEFRMVPQKTGELTLIAPPKIVELLKRPEQPGGGYPESIKNSSVILIDDP